MVFCMAAWAKTLMLTMIQMFTINFQEKCAISVFLKLIWIGIFFFSEHPGAILGSTAFRWDKKGPCLEIYALEAPVWPSSGVPLPARPWIVPLQVMVHPYTLWSGLACLSILDFRGSCLQGFGNKFWLCGLLYPHMSIRNLSWAGLEPKMGTEQRWQGSAVKFQCRMLWSLRVLDLSLP